MEQKTTNELLEQLKNNANINSYIKQNESQLIDSSLAEHLTEMLKTKNLTKAEVIKNSEISEIYGYQIFSGLRKPSRDKIICLCRGMKLDLDETNKILTYAQEATLYAKNKRDSIIIWGINQDNSIMDINEALYDHDEKTLE